jgi:hypothetical protein
VLRALTLAVVAVALAGCALRPRYAQFVSKDTTGSRVQLQLLERSTGMPVAGAVIEVGEYRTRVITRTDGQGLFALPIDRRYLDDNAIIVVSPPVGVGATRVASVEPVVSAPVAPLPIDLDAGAP